jgi:hypothetical protein
MFPPQAIAPVDVERDSRFPTFPPQAIALSIRHSSKRLVRLAEGAAGRGKIL